MRRSVFSLIANAFQHKKPTTFGEHRSQILEERLGKAIQERRTLARAEAASEAPISTHIQARGDMVSSRIGRLQQQTAEDKK